MVTSRKAEPISIDTSSWLTRDQASDLLGIAYITMVQWARKGILHPIVTTRPPSTRVIYLYDPEELRRLPRKFRNDPPSGPGELAARAFEMFCEGRTNMQVVMLTRETPERIEALRESWLDGGGSDLVISPAAKLALEAAVGDFSTVAELVNLVGRVRALVPEAST